MPDIITQFQGTDGVTLVNFNSRITQANSGFNSLDLSKSNKSTSTTATLLASGWTGTTAPYSQTISVTGVTATSVNEILPSLSITSDQLESLQDANLQDGSQSSNSITIKAWGDKPSIDLPIRVIIRGDM